jgi:hypothetical protein
MSTVIKPTVGRVVWFFGKLASDDAYRERSHPGREPLAAIITHVWNDKMVNLVVFDMDGHPASIQSVRIFQDGETVAGKIGGLDRWAEWMPYQKGQAAKAEALEREIHAHGSPHIATSSSEIAGS